MMDRDRLASENREIDRLLDPEDCFCGSHFDDSVEIHTFADKTRFLIWHFKMDIEIAISVDILVSRSTEFDAHSRFDPCWDGDIFFYLLCYESFSMTDMTGIRDDFSSSRTLLTWSRLLDHTENRPRLLAYLPSPMTDVTLRERVGIFRATSRAVRAENLT